WQQQSELVFEKVRALDGKLCGAIMGGLLLIYLFYVYCCMLICQKANHEPGMMIWFPFFQFVPLLRAARMSAAWIVSFILVVPFILFFIIWSFKISEARGKSPLTALCLIFPPTSFLAFLYLAFSSRRTPTRAERQDKRAAEIMTLETA